MFIKRKKEKDTMWTRFGKETKKTGIGTAAGKHTKRVPRQGSESDEGQRAGADKRQAMSDRERSLPTRETRQIGVFV
jgi:hypothetical protein